MWSLSNQLRSTIEHARHRGYTDDEIGAIIAAVCSAREIDLPPEDESGCYLLIMAGLIGAGVGMIYGQGWGFLAAGGSLLVGYALWVLKRKA